VDRLSRTRPDTPRSRAPEGDTIIPVNGPVGNAPSIQELRLGRAYGLVSPARRTDAVARIEPAPAAHHTTDRTGSSDGIRRLVAGVVPGAIAFDAETGSPTPTRAPLSIYRSPADRNAAAVGVELGRTLDLRG
jgi:hypothetical protein